LWAGAAALVIGIAGAAYASMCPKGFVRFSGYPDAGQFSCIDYGGIATPEHYLNLKNRGRLAFFGGPLAGEGGHAFLMRTGGDAGKWICGTTTKAKFAFDDGEAHVENVATILDEATAPRTGTLSLSELGGGVFGDDCKSTKVVVDGDVLKLELEVTSAGGGANTAYTRIDLSMSGSGLRIFTQVDLAAPWPERGDVEREVTYAWVRLTEVIDGQVVRRIAVSGPGSRLTRKDGCARLELSSVTPLAACPGDTDTASGGELDVSW
jgi:hypothetical protein